MNVLRILTKGCVLSAAVSLYGCPDESKEHKTKPTQNNVQVKEKAWIRATVVDMSGLDGCRLLLELSDGRRLQPINLAKDYQKPGLKLRFTYKKAEGYMGICMAGDMVELLAVEIAK